MVYFLRSYSTSRKNWECFCEWTQRHIRLVSLCSISKCVTRWRRGGGLTDPESCRKILALILTLKHRSREPAKPKRLVNVFLRHLERSLGGACRTYWQKITYFLLVRRVLHHGAKNTERQHLFVSTIWKDQNGCKL